METLKQLDEQVFLYLNNLGSSTADGFWMVMTDQWMSIPIYALLSLFILRKTGFKSAVVSGLFILAVVGVTIVISHLIKDGVMRLRPCNLDLNMRLPLGEDCGDYGFVSTHSTVGLALMVFIGSVLKPYYKYIFWPLLLWVGLFGFSRIMVAKHYPGDIIVGYIIGLIVALVFFRMREWVTEKYKV